MEVVSLAISLKPGEQIKRTELHERYGGRRQGGISPSKQSENVFLFTDQQQGAIHGYIYDGFNEADDLYHYTGEGQYGDQRMVQGNKAIRNHNAEGRDLHLFDAGGPTVTYMGEFEYIGDYRADAPETNEGPMRSVIVFRLRRLTGKPALAPSRVNQFGPESVKEVPVEQHLTEQTMVYPNREPYAAERREQKLVRELEASWLAQGHDVCRLQLRPEGEPAPLFCDLYDGTSNTLVEAKGSIARPAIRMAIGQLADYERLLDQAPQKLILVPEEPRPDLLDLAKSQNIAVTWPDGEGGFVTKS
jgi:hypothetical protein